MKDATALAAALLFTLYTVSITSYTFGMYKNDDDTPIGGPITLAFFMAFSAVGFFIAAFPGH
jgi:hypothetical protein